MEDNFVRPRGFVGVLMGIWRPMGGRKTSMTRKLIVIAQDWTSQQTTVFETLPLRQCLSGEPSSVAACLRRPTVLRAQDEPSLGRVLRAKVTPSCVRLRNRLIRVGVSRLGKLAGSSRSTQTWKAKLQDSFQPRKNDRVNRPSCLVTPVERDVNTFNIVCIGFVFVVGGNHNGLA
jgi:hypothetical protein